MDSTSAERVEVHANPAVEVQKTEPSLSQKVEAYTEETSKPLAQKAEVVEEKKVEPRAAQKVDPEPEAKKSDRNLLLQGAKQKLSEQVPDITYNDFTLPDGFSEDHEKVKLLKDFGRNHKLPQEALQQLIDWGVEETLNKRQELSKAWDERLESWASSLGVDREFGGDDFNKNISIAGLAFNSEKMQARFGFELVPPGLRSLLDDRSDSNPDGTGLNNNPEVFRFFYRLGKILENDTAHPGSGSAGLVNEMSAEEYYRSLSRASREELESARNRLMSS